MKYTKIFLKNKTREQLIKIILKFENNLNNLAILNLKIEEGKSYTKIIADGTKGMIRGE